MTLLWHRGGETAVVAGANLTPTTSDSHHLANHVLCAPHNATSLVAAVLVVRVAFHCCTTPGRTWQSKGQVRCREEGGTDKERAKEEKEKFFFRFKSSF